MILTSYEIYYYKLHVKLANKQKNIEHKDDIVLLNTYIHMQSHIEFDIIMVALKQNCVPLKYQNFSLARQYGKKRLYVTMVRRTKLPI